jgi:hypothetical protein
MADIAVFRAASGKIWIKHSGAGYADLVETDQGNPAWLPTCANYDGGVQADYSWFIPSTQTWRVYESSNEYAERCETDGYRQQTWLDSPSADEWAAGCHGKVGVMVNMTERLQAGILGRYDWIEKIAGAVGPSAYERDLDGFSLVAAAAVAF